MATTTATSNELGIYTYADLKRLAGSMPPDLVEGLIAERSVNMLVGDSGLGKTPLCVSLGISVASGVPFLGRKVREGMVLYCDSETALAEFVRNLESLSRVAGLSKPPMNLLTFPLNAPAPDGETDVSPGDSVIAHVREIAPLLVFVDPLRTFWPDAPTDSERTMAMLNDLRAVSKDVGCAWVLVHHRRKHRLEGMPSLEHDPHEWLQESAGSQALINHTDARLGVEPTPTHPQADLLVAGFVRSKGVIPPLYLAREYDEGGEAIGYRALFGLDLLPDNYQQAFMKLPTRFRFTEVKDALGGSSDSNAAAFLNRCKSLGLIKAKGGARGGYAKAMESME